MINLEQIGYFLYMESQEKKEIEEQDKVNVDSTSDLEGIMSSTSQSLLEEDNFPKYHPPS